MVQGPRAQEATIKGATLTDLVLSAEIMVIALREVIDEAVVQKAIILVVVAFLISTGLGGRQRRSPRPSDSQAVPSWSLRCHRYAAETLFVEPETLDARER